MKLYPYILYSALIRVEEKINYFIIYYIEWFISKQWQIANCRYWTPENPHWEIDLHTQYSKAVNEWARVIVTSILGHFFWSFMDSWKIFGVAKATYHSSNSLVWFQHERLSTLLDQWVIIRTKQSHIGGLVDEIA